MVRLVLSAIRERLGETLLLGLLAALVVAVGVAGPLYADAAARNVVAATADTATPAELSLTVTVEMTSRNGFAAALAELRGSVATAPAGPGVREIRGGYRRGAVTPRASGAPVELLLAARDDACAHLALTGACPTAPGEAALAATTASRLGLAVGDTFGFQVQPGKPPAPLRVTGVYAVDGTSATLTDPYWAGRAELTPVPLRAENPIFTVPESLQALDADTFQATLDYVADLTAMSPADVDALARTLRDGDVPGRGIVVTGGLSRLLPQIVADRDTVAVPVVTGAVLLLGVAWWVLLLGVGHAAAARRTQTVLGALRGAPARHRAALTAGPGVLTVLLALPVGLVLGRLLAQLLAWAAMDAAGPVELTVTAVATAVGLSLAVLVSVVVAYVRAQRGGVLDALRQVPARRGAAGGVAVVVVVVLAVAAAVQLRSGDEVLGLAGYVLPAAAPVLTLVAAGLVAARAVRPLAGLLGRAGLRTGRAGTALAALYAARRPGMDRLVALVVIVTALLAHAAYGWQALQAGETERARLALGAAEVVRVRAPSRAALLHHVRQADPAGDWAMAAARQESSSGTTVAVDTSRLARVAYWPATAGVTVERLAQALRPPANPAVRVTGATLLLDLTPSAAVEVDQPLTAVLDGPDGAPVTATSAVVPGRGRQTLRLAVPACASGDGCRLAWLSFRHDPGGLVLHGIAQAGPDAVVADAAAMTDPARWRTTVGAEGRVSLTPLPAGLAVDYEPADPRFPDPEVRVQVADVPLPMPAVLAGQARLAHDRTVLRGEMLSPLRRPVDVLAAVPALPGAGAQGLLVDLEYADRVGDSIDNIADLQVWLSPDAPADALDRLRATGLVPVSAQTAAQRAEHGLAVGLGPGSRFRFGAALLAVLLVMVAVALVVAVDAPRRGVELAALRTQGLPQRAVGRATRSGYVLIVAAAAAGGGLLGAAVADGAAASTLPVAVLAAATLLLSVTAFAVGTRLSKVTGLDLEEGR